MWSFVGKGHDWRSLCPLPLFARAVKFGFTCETLCAALETGIDTHTHTTPISALRRITSHLTSLRKTEKEKETKQAKRAREKGRYSDEAPIVTGPLVTAPTVKIGSNLIMCAALKTGCDTHITPIAARKESTSHLTSLRKKEKEETERANEEGKRER